MALTDAERQKQYRQRHPDRVRVAKGVWQSKNLGRHRDGVRRRNRAYEARNPGRSVARNAKFRGTEQGVACYLYWNAKQRAKRDNLDFALTKAWIQAAVDHGTCQVTGLPFCFDNGRKPWAASLDRIDPKRGYTPDNVRVVVWMYNACKAEFTDADVLKMARALLEKAS